MQRILAFEDEHLLVVRKPPGINTHASGPHAGEGLYEWLRRREPRWASLAIIQRLDKETSGILLFSKTPRANASLTKQFSRRRVAKEYVFWTDREPRRTSVIARSWIRKGRGRFESLPAETEDGLEASTRFEVLHGEAGRWTVRAEPLTGRTHQIRLHAADLGMPILGDAAYGGSPYTRLCLHARRLALRHPATNAEMEFVDEPQFEVSPRAALREAVIDPDATDAFRLVHGAGDGRPGWYVDRLGAFLLASLDEAAGAKAAAPGPGDPRFAPPDWLLALATSTGARGLYLRRLERHIRGVAAADASPAWVWGGAASGEFTVRENGLRFLLSFEEGYSTGLFLDQRDNRRRLLVNWVGPDFPVRPGSLGAARVLNVFAYTCGFSVAAAAAGAITTSLDLSRKYLDWGRRNFAANGQDPAAHDFVYGDAFNWLRRFARKGRRFDVVLLDPPTFSQSREHGVFRAEADYAALTAAAAQVLEPGGVLLASTNAARLDAERFIDAVHHGFQAGGRRIERELFVPQPPDFPSNRDEPAYLKTLWLRGS